MAVRGPKALALAADLADTVTFAAWPGDSRADIMRLAADFRATRRRGTRGPRAGGRRRGRPFMTPPGTDPAALRAADSLAILPSDPAAATEEILRRREDGGFSYFVVDAPAVRVLRRGAAGSRCAGQAVNPGTPARTSGLATAQKL